MRIRSNSRSVLAGLVLLAVTMSGPSYNPSAAHAEAAAAGVDSSTGAWAPVSGAITRTPPLDGDITAFGITFLGLDEPDEVTQTPKQRTARPDQSGHYSFTLPPGRYLVLVRPPGFESDPDNLTSYMTKWWEDVRGTFDTEYPGEAIQRGAKTLVIEPGVPVVLDMMIDRGLQFAATSAPRILGNPYVDEKLKADINVDGWSPTASFGYQWLRDGVAIAGASGPTYVPTTEDLGKTLTLAATGSTREYEPTTRVSPGKMIVLGLTPRFTPQLGTRYGAVGQTLTLTIGEWGPRPVTLSYQWNRDDAAIPGATGLSYKLRSADAGKSITVMATGSKATYVSSSTTSAAVAVRESAPIVERIAGTDRYSESALISKSVAPTLAPLVYLASGEGFADALSGSAIAAQHRAPLLLSTSSTIPKVVADEISRLKPTDIVVLGGERTLKASVVAQLNSMWPSATVTRVGGADRFEVSRNLISDPKFGAAPSSSLFVASGLVFPDALSASPAAAKISGPILLVNGQQTALSFAESSLVIAREVSDVTVFGGTASLTSALQADLATKTANVTRIAGQDRYAVSAAIGTAMFPPSSDVSTVYLAAGATYPDALAGGVLAGMTSSPMFLAQSSCLDAGIASQIEALNVTRVVILGGQASIAFSKYPFPACA